MKMERAIATVLYMVSMLELFKRRHELITAMENILSNDRVEEFKFREDLNSENPENPKS